MNLSIFGLGYVGSVSAVGLARLGHDVIGVDVVPEKVAMMNEGEPPVAEPGLKEALAEVRADGMIRATTDSSEAVLDSDVSLICVGTPSAADGGLDPSALVRVARTIAAAVREKGRKHTVVVRSTTPPGTIDMHVVPALEDAAGGELPDGMEVLVNPEFLREGQALSDFFAPPLIVVGGKPEVAQRYSRIYESLDAPVRITGRKEAEALKLVCNAFHALKITFANEVGNVLAEAGVDAGEVMNLFCEDTVLNISPKYLKPGFAFGGSCLPKDLRALVGLADQHHVRVPVIEHITDSNELQIQRAFRYIRNLGKRRVGLLGLAFKPNTDDLRESPYLSLAEILRGKGYEVAIYDPNLKVNELMGSNLEYLESTLPHVGEMLRDSPEEVARQCDALIVCHSTEEIERVAHSADHCEVIYLDRPLALGSHHARVPIFSNAVPSFTASE